MKAFTLIELIIVVTIISLLTGGTIAFYTSYSQRVKLETATKNFVDSLYLARKKARAADASQCPSGETVLSYQVEKKIDSDTEYQIIPVCSPGDQNPSSLAKTLDNGVKFKSFPTPVKFEILTASSPSSSPVCIILGLNDDCRYASVSAEGVISDGKLSSCSDSCP